MNCFQFVRSVLDELYEQIRCDYGDQTDQVIKQELKRLSEQYKSLITGNNIDYSDLVTRFAYIYTHTTVHADMVYQIISQSSKLRKVFELPTMSATCIGGGPGSDFLGILKFITLTSPEKLTKLKCFLCDKAQAWRDSWCDIDEKVSLPVHTTSTVFWELDITESDSVQNSTKAFNADLFTMIYCISELYSSREDSRNFFEAMIHRARPGACFLFVDNNTREFYEWFDEVATQGGLATVKHTEGYHFSLGHDEQKEELEGYIAKFGWYPKLTTSIAYRIYVKPEEYREYDYLS